MGNAIVHKQDAVDFWENGLRIVRDINTTDDTIDVSMGSYLTVPSHALLVNGAALHRIRVWAGGASLGVGSTPSIRGYRFPVGQRFGFQDLSLGTAGDDQNKQSMGHPYFDATLTMSGTGVYDTHPVTRATGTGLRWFECSGITWNSRRNEQEVKSDADAAQTGAAAIIVITMGSPSGGTFTVTVRGETTAAQAYNVSTANLQTALQGLSTVGSGGITVSGTPGTTYTLTAAARLLNQELAISFADSTTGGSGMTQAYSTRGKGGSQQMILDSMGDGLIVFEPYAWGTNVTRLVIAEKMVM